MFTDVPIPAWLASKAALVSFIMGRGDIPQIIKTAAVGLSFVSEADFARLRDTFLEIVAALSETERGRAILLDMRLDDWIVNAASGNRGE